MSKKKLTLKELKVKSFVTEAQLFDENTLKGGRAGTHYERCEPGYTENLSCWTKRDCPEEDDSIIAYA